MTCHDAREQFSGLVDDALSADVRATVDAHLATCAECRGELQRFRATVGLLGALAPARAPAGFVDRVLDAARPVPWPRRLVRGLFLPWPVKLPMEAAAIVLVAVGVGLVYRGTSDIQEATRLEPAAPVVTRAPASGDPQAPAPARPRETGALRETFTGPELDKAKEQITAGATEFSSRREPAPATDKKADEEPALAKLQPTEVPSRDIEQQPMRDRQARQEVGGKPDAPPAEAERARARENAGSQPAPTPAARADSSKASGPKAAPSVAASSTMPSGVSGRLAVNDRDLALRDIAQLIARLGAVEDRRFDVSDGQILELTVPRAAYPEFVRELGRLGRWQPSAEPSALPAQIRVVLRITS